MGEVTTQRVCVLCGLPAREGKNSCWSCGAAVVDTRTPEAAAAAGSPGARAAGDPWAPPPPPSGPALRPRRTPFWAYLMIAVLLVGIVLAALTTWNAYTRPSYPVPKDLRAYANGSGDVYATADFAVRLPYGYQRFRVSPAPAQPVPMTAAETIVGDTSVIFASGTVRGPVGKPTRDDAIAVARAIGTSFKRTNGVLTVELVHTGIGSGFDYTLRQQDGMRMIGRVVVTNTNQLVCFIVVSKQPADGVLRALEASYQPTNG